MHDHRRKKHNEVYLIVVIGLCLSKIVHGFITVPRMSPSGIFLQDVRRIGSSCIHHRRAALSSGSFADDGNIGWYIQATPSLSSGT